MVPKIPSIRRESVTDASRAPATAPADTGPLRRRSVEQPLNESSASANGGNVVASHIASPGRRATAESPVSKPEVSGAEPHVRLGPLDFRDEVLKANDQESRDATIARFETAEANGQLICPMHQCTRNLRESIQANLEYAHVRTEETDDPVGTNKMMKDAGNLFAFLVSMEGPEAQAGSMAGHLDQWVKTIDTLTQARHFPESGLWMNQAAVFSFLTYPENDRSDWPSSANPPPLWLSGRRQILQDDLKRDVARIEPPIRTATGWPNPLSELSAVYAAASQWDECLARLHEATPVHG